MENGIKEIEFSIPFFDIYDPRFPDFGVPVAARGSISVEIKNAKKLKKRYSNEEFNRQIRILVNERVKSALLSLATKPDTSVLQIEGRKEEISNMVTEEIAHTLRRILNLKVLFIAVTAIEFDKASAGYHHLREITQDVTIATVHAETEATIYEIKERRKIDTANYEEELRAKRERKRIGDIHRRVLGWTILGLCILSGIIVMIALL